MAPRHRLYTPEIAETILERLADGEGLIAICRDDGMPSDGAVRHWVATDHEGFAARYARAREAGVLRLADELLEIADDGCADVGNPANVQRSRLKVDTRKFLLAKLVPKTFGDRVDLNHSGEIALKDVPDDQLEARLAQLLRAAGVGLDPGGSGETEG